MNKKNKCILLLFFLMTIFILISISSYANTISQNLSNNFFRLHILANSDSKVDQELKLKVRDEIISFMKSLSYNCLTKQEVINLTQENLENFKQIAKQTITSEGFNYPVNIEVGNYYFPTKRYGNIALPTGYYDALKIEIGNAQGQNWWCSLFPPLCFVDISSGVIDNKSENDLKNKLSEEEFAIITDNSETIKFKFKLLEIFSN